ncbi:hypothetical protein ACVBEG_27765 [Pseudomonas sp. GG8]
MDIAGLVLVALCVMLGLGLENIVVGLARLLGLGMSLRRRRLPCPLAALLGFRFWICFADCRMMSTLFWFSSSVSQSLPSYPDNGDRFPARSSICSS